MIELDLQFKFVMRSHAEIRASLMARLNGVETPDDSSISLPSAGNLISAPRASYLGVDIARKQQIIEKLCPLMPEDRRDFWRNL